MPGMAAQVWRVAVVLAAMHASDAALFATRPFYREHLTRVPSPLTSNYHRYPSDPQPQLPLDHPSLQPRVGVQQLHITQGSSPGEVIIQWAENTTDASASIVKYRLAKAGNGGEGVRGLGFK